MGVMGALDQRSSDGVGGDGGGDGGEGGLGEGDVPSWWCVQPPFRQSVSPAPAPVAIATLHAQSDSTAMPLFLLSPRAPPQGVQTVLRL